MASGTKINIDLVLNTKGFRPLGRINGQLGEFEKSLDASNARVLAFGASAGAILAVKKAFTATVRSMIEVEKSLTDINVVLNTSSANLKKFGSDLFTIASQTGQSFKVAAEAATEFSRQGLGLTETLKRTRDALILARLSGMEATEAVNSLTAALNTFNDVGLDSTTIINKLANVDAAFAVSSDDLAKALGRVGASAKGAGVNFDQLLAIVTTAQQKTARGGAVIGNSFKTIFTRIQRPKVLNQLEELGVQVKGLSGETLPAIKILTNLARSFDFLTQAQRAQVAELVGGVFQVNILKAAMSDLSSEQSIYSKALKVSASSTDEAIQRNTRLNETLSAQFNRVVNSFKEGAAELGTLTLEPAIRNLLNVGDAIADASKSESGVAKAGQFIGKTLFGAIGKFMGGPGLLIIGFTLFKTFKQLGTFAADAFKTLTGLNKNFQNQLNLQKQIFEVLSENPDLMNKIKNGTLTVEEAHEQIYDQIQKNTGALDAQLLVSQQLAQSLVGSGVGISPDFGATTGGKKEFGGKKKGKKSFGYVPNFFEDRDEVLGMMRGGYSSSQIKNPRTRKQTLHDGRGGSFRATVNGHEDIFNARSSKGKRGTFVVPPKGSEAYEKYMAGLQGGQRGKTMAEGFIPNFIKVPWLKTGKASNKIGEVRKGDVGDVSNRQVQSLVDKGYIADPRTKTAAAKKTSKKSTKTIREKNLEKKVKKGAMPIDVKGAYGVLSLFGGAGKSLLEGKGSIGAKTGGLTAIGGNTAAIPSDIVIKNFQKRTFIGKPDGKGNKSNEFADMVRDRFREPFADLTGDFIKKFGINKKHVNKLDRTEAAKITESLFPEGAEGSIFEAAISAITQDSNTFRKGLKGSSNLTWDFDGKSKANSTLKDAFNMKGLQFADGKRTVDSKVEQDLANKVFTHVEKGFGGRSKATGTIKELIKASNQKKKSSGYIPNFNALFESVRREKDAGVDRNTIRLDRDSNLVSSSNPLGLGVYNTEDEPRGLKQGISRERGRGRNPKRSGGKSRGYIPNFAPKPKPPAKGGSDGGGDVKEASGIFASSAGKLGAGIFGMQMGFSTLQTAVEGNQTATWALKETEQTLTNAVYLLMGAQHLLKKSNDKLAAVNKKRAKGGKDPIEETKLTDAFTSKGRKRLASNKKIRDAEVSERFEKTGFRFEKGTTGRRLENLSKGRDRRGRFMKRKGPMRGLMRRGAGMAARVGAGAGAAGGGGLAAVGAAAAPVAAALGAVYVGIKATDAFFQFFKVRDAEKAKKSFDAITQRNQQLSNDLQKYSEALQKFSQSMDGASVEDVMTATSQLNSQLMKLGPEIREKFATQFDPVSANALIIGEQQRLANENKRAENKTKLADKTAKLGEKEGIWENFKRGISGGALGAQIDEKSEERDFRRLSQNILGADENVKGGLGAALKRKSGEEGGAEKVQDIINTLSSGNPKEVADALRSLGYSQETIDTFQQSMERSGTAGLRLREGMASLVIETDKANQLQKALAPTIKRITEEIAKQRSAIDKQVKSMEVERKIRLKVGAEMAKGANLFLSSIGQVDLKREMDLTSARGNRAVALTKAANITQTAFGSQGAQELLGGIQGGAQIGAGVNAGIRMLGSTNPQQQAQGTAMLKAAQAQLNAQVESANLDVAQESIAKQMQGQLSSLVSTEKNSGEELKNQTKEINAVADAQKKTLEIQKKIATAGGVRFEGFGEQLKKLSTNRLLGGIAARTGSGVGAARFKGREMDIMQELQGGTLTASQRPAALQAARIEGQHKLDVGSRMGLQGGAFDTSLGRADAARLKSQARFKTDAVTGAGAPPEVTQALLHSQKTFENLTETMREVTEQNIALEKKKQEQMEIIAKLTKEFNDHLKEQAELRKKAADFEARNGLALVNGIKGFSEGVSKFKTAQEQGMRGALSIDLSGIGDAKIRQEVALSIKEMDRAQASQNAAANKNRFGLLNDSAGQASALTGTQNN